MDFNKYLTNKNVAILGTFTFHVLLFAIFTHVHLQDNTNREVAELVINFTELEQEEIIEPEEKTEEDNSLLDEFTKPLTNLASNRSNKDNIEELRASMKSLENVRDNNKEVDLFSDEAENREIKIKHLEEDKEGKGDKERKTENAFTGRSTINYYLQNRYSDKLPNPIYTCITGGLIHVNIKVNQNGNVVDVEYNRRKSTTTNECLRETALKYAKRAKFNSDFEAKENQKGYISYQFHKN